MFDRTSFHLYLEWGFCLNLSESLDCDSVVSMRLGQDDSEGVPLDRDGFLHFPIKLKTLLTGRPFLKRETIHSPY